MKPFYVVTDKELDGPYETLEEARRVARGRDVVETVAGTPERNGLDRQRCPSRRGNEASIRRREEVKTSLTEGCRVLFKDIGSGVLYRATYLEPDRQRIEHVLVLDEERQRFSIHRDDVYRDDRATPHKGAAK